MEAAKESFAQRSILCVSEEWSIFFTLHLFTLYQVGTALDLLQHGLGQS